MIGTRLSDGLQVLRELDRGVSSRVFLASDGKRVAALKLFEPRNAARARRELDVGKGLDHPNLNPVTEAVEIDEHPGVLMPLVNGVRLTRWLAGGPDLSRRLETLAGVADALGHLHGLGVVHRDVKPENILVDKASHATLLDFDLAARIGEDAPASIAGTIAYLSPEQARSEPATPAADMYGFGALLYQSLSGQVPFTGTVAEVLQAHAKAAPQRPSSLRTELAPLDELLLALLRKDPRRRPSVASTVAAEMRAAARELIGGAA